jgi:hypothetical protein
MLKADAQIAGSAPSRSGRHLGLAGIVFALVIPAFFVVGGDWDIGGVVWGPLDAITTTALFASPALLAALALAHRPVLFIAAAVTACIALPLFLLAPPMLIAAILWILAFERKQSTGSPWDARRLGAVVVSSTMVVGAAAVLLLIRSPMVCTSEVTYADGTVRRATKVESQPHRRTESIPFRSGERTVGSSTTCSEAALLPERSALILAMLGVGYATGIVFAPDRGRVA